DTVFDRFGSDFYFRYVQNQLSDDGLLLQNDLRGFGFGAPTGIDLPSEGSGLVPDPAWAKTQPTLFPDGWVPGGDILTMIGSTYVMATPLQLAQAYSAIANGGHLCHPHVVDEVVAPDGTVVKQPQGRCIRTIPYAPSELAYIRGALGSVITSGTASCTFQGFPTSKVWVGGKTGTAERPPHQDTSWFAAMAGQNQNAPKYVVIAMVEQGGFGATGAAPAALVLVKIPGIGATDPSGVAQRWFAIAGLQITPSEITKVCAIVMLAAILSEIRAPEPALGDLVRVLAVAAVPLVLVFIQ